MCRIFTSQIVDALRQQAVIGLLKRNLLLIFDPGRAAGAGVPLPQTGDSSRAGDLLPGQGMAWL